jgi:DNA-binding transcriptional LysR family regulator
VKCLDPEAILGRLECDRMSVAVMEAGSFKAAAARWGTSSGLTSNLVSRLKADPGVRLLNPITRSLAPKPAKPITTGCGP